MDTMFALLQALLLQQLATRSTALHEAARLTIDNPTLPRDGRAAIVIRGQAFRCHGPHASRLPCCKSAIQRQEEATASLVRRVIKPLEARGNKVEVVVTDAVCNYTEASILRKLDDRGEQGSKRVLRWEQWQEEGPHPQSNNMRFALETFKRAAGGSGQIAKSYDLVLVVRQDTNWKKPINEWTETNFSKFNFASRCERTAVVKHCNNDMLHTMPGGLFPAFDSEVGTKDCYFVSPGRCQGEQAHCFWDSGHGCMPQVQSRMGEDKVGFITGWVPRKTVREINNYWAIYC